jgi:hypothetical protein
MRRLVKLSLLCLAAGAGACSTPELEHPTENLPYAGVRFINAVPDTGGAFGLDFRFVDLLESNAHYRITFRNSPTGTVPSAIQFKGAREGNRQFRVFLDDTLQAVAKVVLKDTTVSLTKLHNYTAILWGTSRNPGATMKLTFWDDEADAGTVAPGKIKLRAINATSAAVDVYTFVGATVPGTPTFAAVPAYSRSAYAEVDSGSYNYQVRTAGTATVIVATSAAMAGAVPTCSGRPANEYTAANPSGCPTGQPADIEALPGTKVAGTALTGIVFPPSVAGSKAAQFAATGIGFMWDKRPPRICDPYC